MNQIEELKKDFTQRFSKLEGFEFSNQFGNDALEIPKEFILPTLQHLKDSGRFDFLMDLTGNDFPQREKRFEVVYHLFDSKTSRRLRVKTRVR